MTATVVGTTHSESRQKTEVDWYSSDGTVSWNEYDRLRPSYSGEIYQVIAEYMAEYNQTNRALCVDYGSGSGAAVPGILTQCGISKVLRTDLHARQLEEGDARLKVVFQSDRIASMVGAAGTLDDISDASVDLVTAAEACHYFDQAKWLVEAARILKPTGTLAFWHYRPQPIIVSHPAAADPSSNLFWRFVKMGSPRTVGLIEACKTSVSLLDSVLVDSDTFSDQKRRKWLLPDDISKRITKESEYGLIDSYLKEHPIEDHDLRVGLSIVDKTQNNIVIPNSSQHILLKQEGWTTQSLVQYLLTLGIPTTALRDERFQADIKETEKIVGGPNGKFDVGWTIGLVLATRK